MKSESIPCDGGGGPFEIRIQPGVSLWVRSYCLTPDEEAGLTILAHDLFHYLHPDKLDSEIVQWGDD